jgi:hypothetical protein
MRAAFRLRLNIEERKMEVVSFERSVRKSARVVVFVDVQPRQTLSWRLARDTELRVLDASVWLTRHLDPYDYWLKPGDVVRLVRGERVWISSESAQAVEISLTSHRAMKRGLFARRWPRALNAI